MIRQADPYDKTEDATIGGQGLQNLTSPKHLEIIFFTCKGIVSSILDYKSQEGIIMKVF